MSISDVRFVCTFASWHVRRGRAGITPSSLGPIQKAITEFRRGLPRAKLTKGFGGPRLSRPACPIPNVAGAANWVTAIRTGQNEIRRNRLLLFITEGPRLTIFSYSPDVA